ncbi:MAG: excinuclease ABC subunit UvrB, partial [Anaerolineae bacterium]|nr:excinuclease ABC subunit UvrB [Anaerolineae bacterium]
ASVSCIYGLGNPAAWGKAVLKMVKGSQHRRDLILRHLVGIQYGRNDIDLRPGTFRVRGDTLEIIPAYSTTGYRVAMFGDEIETLTEFDPLTGEILAEHDEVSIFPAKQFVTEDEKIKQALFDIEKELEDRLAELQKANRLLEAQRIEQRTRYDLEMIREIGYTSGIENYSRHLDQRPAGSPPWTLLDYFPSGYLMIIDESHMTLPQVRGMHGGDRSRKSTLVEYGFRLPSAMDNRPLSFEEFETRTNQMIFMSATPGPYEAEHNEQVVQQIIRPTGIVDPTIAVRPIAGQIDDLLAEINRRVQRGERALVTTLTKRMAEDLADYLLEMGVRVHYLHSEIDTIERIEILRDLRMGVYDVVVGINLLREGLDLPEVSLVAILDADKQGFLRSEQALIQNIGRAARHIEGHVIMYADKVTDAMRAAIDETERRRAIQQAHNEEHNIEPASIIKEIRDLTARLRQAGKDESQEDARSTAPSDLPKPELQKLIDSIENEMKAAAKSLEFEKAAVLRDQLLELRQVMALKDHDRGDPSLGLVSQSTRRPRPTP